MLLSGKDLVSFIYFAKLQLLHLWKVLSEYRLNIAGCLAFLLIRYKGFSLPADWPTFLFSLSRSTNNSITCRSHKLLISQWANNKHDPKTQETRRETETETEIETNKPKTQNSWLAFHLPGSRYVVRLVFRILVCPPKRKSRQKRDFQDSATKVKVTSLLQIRVFRPGSTYCHFRVSVSSLQSSVFSLFSVPQSPRVCHFRKWKSSAVRNFVSIWIEIQSAAFGRCSWKWISWAASDFRVSVFHFRALNSSLSISSPGLLATWVHFTSIDRRARRISAATMEAEEVTKLVDGVYRVSLFFIITSFCICFIN